MEPPLRIFQRTQAARDFQMVDPTVIRRAFFLSKLFDHVLSQQRPVGDTDFKLFKCPALSQGVECPDSFNTRKDLECHLRNSSKEGHGFCMF